jgi:hypothetical protein
MHARRHARRNAQHDTGRLQGRVYGARLGRSQADFAETLGATGSIELRGRSDRGARCCHDEFEPRGPMTPGEKIFVVSLLAKLGAAFAAMARFAARAAKGAAS